MRHLPIDPPFYYTTSGFRKLGTKLEWQKGQFPVAHALQGAHERHMGLCAFMLGMKRLKELFVLKGHHKQPKGDPAARKQVGKPPTKIPSHAAEQLHTSRQVERGRPEQETLEANQLSSPTSMARLQWTEEEGADECSICCEETEPGDEIVASGTFLIASESRLRAALETWR